MDVVPEELPGSSLMGLDMGPMKVMKGKDG